MSVEEQTLTKILNTGLMRIALQHKLKLEVFQSPVNQEVFLYLLEHYESGSTQGQIPSLETVTSKFPLFEFEESDLGLETLCGILRDKRLTAELGQAIEYVESLVVERPEKALDLYKQTAHQLSLKWSISAHEPVPDIFDGFVDQVKKIKSGEAVVIPYPWPSIQKASSGLREGDLVVLYGRTKKMKSWVLWYFAHSAWVSGYRVLLVSPEMSAEESTNRLVSLAAQVSYSDLDQAKLSLDEYDQISSFTHKMLDANPTEIPMVTVMSSDKRQINGLDSIRAAIEELRPQLVCLDSAYLINRKSGGTLKWSVQAELAMDLHSLAVETKVPIVLTNQANRENLVSYSEGWVQAADVIISIRMLLGYHKTHVTEERRPLLYLKTEHARRFSHGGMVIEAYPGEYMNEIESFSSGMEADNAYEQAFGQGNSEELVDGITRRMTGNAAWGEEQQ